MKQPFCCEQTARGSLQPASIINGAVFNQMEFGMNLGALLLSRLLFSLAVAALILAVDGAQAQQPQQQQACAEDFQKLTQKRMAAIEKLNALGKAGKGKMDPMAACPVAKALGGVETEMLNYMTKNKEWCNIPENVIDGFKDARTKSQGFAKQACDVAAKMKKMQEEGAAGGGMGAPPRLPSGPL